MSCSKEAKPGGLLALIARGREALSRSGIEEAKEECERILMKLLGCSRSGIYLEDHEATLPEVRENFLALIEKRTHRVPLAYLLKETDFWQETLFVDERCLIPRPETEILVEQVLKAIKGTVPLSPFSFLDIGTGSGAIAVAILRASPNARGTLLDISAAALEVAWGNIEKYGLEDRATLVLSNVFRGLPPSAKGERGGFDKSPPTLLCERGELGNETFDLIVSNPPYLSEADWAVVQEELKHEPRQALDGGKDGLDFYREIVAGAQERLTLGGLLALEVGQNQAERVSKWLHEAGYVNIQRFKDHLQVERVVLAQRNS